MAHNQATEFDACLILRRTHTHTKFQIIAVLNNLCELEKKGDRKKARTTRRIMIIALEISMIKGWEAHSDSIIHFFSCWLALFYLNGNVQYARKNDWAF